MMLPNIYRFSNSNEGDEVWFRWFLKHLDDDPNRISETVNETCYSDMQIDSVAKHLVSLSQFAAPVLTPLNYKTLQEI